jgi:hypothetical protein
MAVIEIPECRPGRSGRYVRISRSTLARDKLEVSGSDGSTKKESLMPTERPGVSTGVKVEQPITIRTIERKRRDGDSSWEAVRVRLECAVLLDHGEADPGLLKALDWQDACAVTVIERANGAAVLEAYPNLAFRDASERYEIYSNTLERFIKLGTTPDIAAMLDDLSDDPKQEPVVLRTGTLAALLEYGITPTEIWIELLNHGAARLKPTAVFDPWLENGKKSKRLKTAIQYCAQAAKALRKVQSMDMTGPLAALEILRGIELVDSADPLSEVKTVPVRPAKVAEFCPQPALALGKTAQLIADMEQTAKDLGTYLPLLSQPAKRPENLESAEFCRDWYKLATERAGNPLYAQGAALHALVFGREPNTTSFKALCMRAKAVKKLSASN